MVKLIYTIIYYMLSPLMCIRWFFKSLKPPQYREPFRQRFGFVNRHVGVDIWFHAVSMGETSGAISIIRNLLKTNHALKVVVTTTTPTGAKLLKQTMGDKVIHYYSPCDLPGTIKRFINRINPKTVVIMETELWPNWIDYISKRNIPLILANARLSESSAKKYELFPKTSRRLFSQISHVLTVNKADAKRFNRIGVKSNRLLVTGNIKFDAEFPIENEAVFYPYWNDSFVWVAASTHQGEEELILEAHKKLLKSVAKAKLILVPRHPERFSDVADLIKKEKFSFAKRSNENLWQEQHQVLLGDTMGELLLAYQKSDVSFIGGSFADIGGHNAIEAAYYSKPILTGPIYYNFQYLFDSLCEENAAEIVENSDELAQKLAELASNPERTTEMGNKAKLFIEKNKGALDKVVNEIQNALS